MLFYDNVDDNNIVNLFMSLSLKLNYGTIIFWPTLMITIL
jgi:hypothetical protein